MTERTMTLGRGEGTHLPIFAEELTLASVEDFLARRKRLYESERTPEKRCAMEEARAAAEAAEAEARAAAERAAAMTALDALMAQFREVPISEKPPARNPTTKDILKEVAAQHGFSVANLLGPRRVVALVRARQEAMYRIITERPHMSYPAIGRAMARDHTTILHGVRSHAARHGLPLPDRSGGAP